MLDKEKLKNSLESAEKKCMDTGKFLLLLEIEFELLFDFVN